MVGLSHFSLMIKWPDFKAAGLRIVGTACFDKPRWGHAEECFKAIRIAERCYDREGWATILAVERTSQPNNDLFHSC